MRRSEGSCISCFTAFLRRCARRLGRSVSGNFLFSKFPVPRSGHKIRLENLLLPGEALTGLEAGRSVSAAFLFSGDGKIRLENFLFPGEALTGLEAGRSVSEMERSVSKISCSHKKKRSPGWRREDPSRGISYSQEMERSVLKISCSQERRSPGWRWKDPSRKLIAPRRGARRAGGGKIRLGDFSFPGEAVTGLEAERSVSRR